MTTSLPFIVTEFGLGENYIWVTTIVSLTRYITSRVPPRSVFPKTPRSLTRLFKSAAVQPLLGQLANIWGRRYITPAIIALFTLGSGIAGGANNAAALIDGRAVQGIGSGGINMIVDVIPAAIFNNYFDRVTTRISDQEVAAMFRNGKAYESISASFLDTFPEPVKGEIIGVYSESLKYVWRMSVIFASLAFLTFLERQLHMRTELDTEFGLDEGRKGEKDAESGEKTALEGKSNAASFIG